MDLNLILMATKKLAPSYARLHFFHKRIAQDYSLLQYASPPPSLEHFSSHLPVLRLPISSSICFQKDDERSELLESDRVDSKPSELPEKKSIEMDGESNGETRNSVFCSVSMETISSLKMGSSEFTCGRKEFDMGYIDPALDVVSKGRNSGVLKILDVEHVAEDDISVKAQIVDSENNASNMFDSLPEPEVQVLWEDYSIPSDSESAGDSTNGCPKINHDQVDSSSKEIKAEENKQLGSLNNLAQKEEESVDISEKSTETTLQEKPSVLNYGYQYELNYLPDHQDIVQQLEMELRNARTGGLPTIFEEETETAEAIDEKLKYEELMGEIQKMYRNYAEKMWKLDILNNQSMHAIGLLQLIYPLQSISAQNSQNSQLWLGKARKLGVDPRLEFIGDLLRDMELVYVGQVCLSWEILQWQLRKALELQRHDSQGIRQYNQVASEFQLFQVMLKRFMGEERSRGHRVQNYVQNRCVYRSLLLVPPIKDDDSTEGEGREWEDENGFSSNILAEVIEKSMWVFYEFLLSDKDDVKNILKSNRKHRIELQNSENPQLLLVNIQAHFQKAERKLKDLLRGNNNGSVKKLGKQEEGGLSYSLILLIAQVDLKLISRVLRMSKLTVDQLLWCNQKLDQLTFENRKVHLEPSLLLFPF